MPGMTMPRSVHRGIVDPDQLGGADRQLASLFAAWATR